MIKLSMRKILALMMIFSVMMPATAADDYLCDFPQSLKFYQYLHWQPYEFPLKVHISEVPSPVTVKNDPSAASANPVASNMFSNEASSNSSE